MRIFVTLYLIAFVFADKLGYNYRPVAHSSFGLSFAPGSTENSNSFSYNSHTASESVNQPQLLNAPSRFGYETEFYTFTAPEDVFADQVAVKNIAETLKKKVRVIFIKNPENTAYENAVLALSRHAAEQRTAIYVLNKQHDISELAEKFNAIQSHVNRKPEVNFVKYRTAEDAYNAQRTIQSQYDSLGGYTHINNPGHVPVLKFASPAPKHFHGSFQTP